MEFTNERLMDVVNECLRLPDETDWVEFKINNSEYNSLWERLSWLSNTACLSWRDYGILIFWIEDVTLEIKWTNFKPDTKKEWGQPFLFKLSKDLQPSNVTPRVEKVKYNNKDLVIFLIPSAIDSPTTFKKIPYWRVGTATPPLSEYPDKQRKIWNNIYNKNFEKQIATSWLNSDEVFEYLDIDGFFSLLGYKKPENKKEVIEILKTEKIIKETLSRFDITNLWSILFANAISKFDAIKNKWVRIIVYDGVDKSADNKSYDGNKWYALWFEDLLKHISLLIPSFEKIVDGKRVSSNAYPSIAMREFVANAIVHQDFSIWAPPKIEIYKDRIEVSNSWQPIIEVERFIDSWKARNEDLSDLMRKMKFCEKLWSGYDKAIIAIEKKRLPAPKIETKDEEVVVTLYWSERVSNLSKEDRVRACFQHCAIKYVTKEDYMSNSSFRERMWLTEAQHSTWSKIIKDTIESWLIKELDPENKANRYTKYVPFWH